jgi:hypothetical protein
MRPLLLALVAALVAALPSSALAARTSTPVRVLKPAAGNATVAGFELRLVKKQPTAAPAAVKLPKGISVFAVLAKQKRTDRVRGVLVVVSRADAVSATAAASTVLVKLRHAAIPSGFSTKLSVKQRRNVLSSGRAFRCLSWFRTSDLRNAVSLGGPAVPGLSARDAVTAACAAAKSRDPFPGESEFRQALNAPTGFLGFSVNAAAPKQLNGSASFNYPVSSFSVLADKSHSFTACSFAAGSCRLLKKRHASDYAVLKLAQPVAANTPLAFVLGLSKTPKPGLPFEFFGTTARGKRESPLLTTGP